MLSGRSDQQNVSLVASENVCGAATQSEFTWGTYFYLNCTLSLRKIPKNHRKKPKFLKEMRARVPRKIALKVGLLPLATKSSLFFFLSIFMAQFRPEIKRQCGYLTSIAESFGFLKSCTILFP